MGPYPDRLPAEFARLVLPVSPGFGLCLPLHEFEQGVRSFQLLYRAPFHTVGVPVHLLVEELGAGYFLPGEVHLAHDCVQVAVHVVADVRLLVSNVVAVGLLPLDRGGAVAPHDGVVHGDGAEEGVDHFCTSTWGQFEGLLDRGVVELPDLAERGICCVELTVLVLTVVNQRRVAKVGAM